MPGALSPETLEKLSRPSPWRSWTAIAREWAAILACFWLVTQAPHWGVWHWPIWVACFVLLGRQNYALLQLTHESAHGHLFKSKGLNDAVGLWLCGAPSTFNMYSFRTFHLRHHSAPLSDRDPDFRFTAGYPISKASFRRKVLRDLGGITNWRGHIKGGFRYFLRSEKTPAVLYQYGAVVLVLALMQTAFWLAGHWLYFMVFWIVPAATVGVSLFRIAVISVHAGLAPNEDQSRCTRTIVNPWQNFWIAPCNAGYHLEHHLFPKAPSHSLPEIHRLLAAQGLLPVGNIYTGYGPILRQIVR